MNYPRLKSWALPGCSVEGESGTSSDESATETATESDSGTGDVGGEDGGGGE